MRASTKRFSPSYIAVVLSRPTLPAQAQLLPGAGLCAGAGLPTMVMAREGGNLPFDIATLSGLHWTTRLS